MLCLPFLFVAIKGAHVLSLSFPLLLFGRQGQSLEETDSTKGGRAGRTRWLSLFQESGTLEIAGIL